MTKVVQETVVRIGSDIKEALSGLNKVGTRAQDLSRSMSRSGRAISRNFTVPLAAAGAAAFAAAVRIGGAADELLGLEQQTGLSTDALQEFRRVATIAGADQDAVADAAGRLSRRLKAIGEESTAVQSTLSRLGVRARDAEGNLRSMDDVLPELIHAFQGMEDITERNSLAVEVFGRGASKIAPILGMTTEAVESARQEAHDLGLVLSRDAIDAADAFRLRWDTLRETLGGVADRIGMAVLPIIDRLVDSIQTQVVPTIERAVSWFESIDKEMVMVVGTVMAVVASIGPLVLIGGKLVAALGLILSPAGLVIAALAAIATTAIVVAKNWDVIRLQGTLAWTALKSVVFNAVDGILGMLERLTSRIPYLGEKVRELRQGFDDFATRSLAKSGERIYELEQKINDAGAATAAASASTRDAAHATDTLATSLGGAADQTDSITEALTRHESQLRQVARMAEIMGGDYDATAEEARVFARTLEDLVSAGLDATDSHVLELRDRLLELRVEVAEGTEEQRQLEAALRDAAQTTQSLRTPTEVYADEIERLTEHLEAGRISQETFSRGVEAAAKALEESGEKAQEVGDEFGSVAARGIDAFADFATGAEAAISDFVKQAIRDLARLAVRMAAVRLIGSVIPGAGGVLALGGIPGRASGGPVTRGQPYIVGERGPELFVPPQSGGIVPNHSLRSGGQSLEVDASKLPRPLTPFEAARDAQWQELIRSTLEVAKNQGWRD